MRITPKFCWNDGQKIPPGSTFPHECWACGQINYVPVPTVAAVLLPVINSGVSTLLCVRRKDGHTEGKLALPGGYQVSGETMREAAAREVLEETGLVIDAASLVLRKAQTVEDGSINLVIFEAVPIPAPMSFHPDGIEVSEVVPITSAVETAFPIHTAAIAEFFSIEANDVVPASPTYIPI